MKGRRYRQVSLKPSAMLGQFQIRRQDRSKTDVLKVKAQILGLYLEKSFVIHEEPIVTTTPTVPSGTVRSNEFKPLKPMDTLMIRV
jgi:hypothetical protein